MPSSILSLFANVLVVFLAYSAGVLTGSRYCQCHEANDGYKIITTTDSKKCPPCPSTTGSNNLPPHPQETNADVFLFPASINRLFAGASLIPRDEFAQLYDTGVPMDLTTPGNEHVLLLHSTNQSLPNHHDQAFSRLPIYENAEEGTQNCHIVKVILTQPPTQQNRDHQQCIAIMGQWDSYQVHKFMRLNPKSPTPKSKQQYGLGSEFPPQYVAQGQTTDNSGPPKGLPGPQQTERFFDTTLRSFLTQRGETLKRLKPIAKKAAGRSKSNTVVAMVSNSGQSSLVWNFVCAAQSRNLDLSHVLLFATDSEMAQLGHQMGLHVFELPADLLGTPLPTKAAPRFGASLFGAMVMVKVVAAYLINALGYDLLFQDVDVVWYQNPLEFFEQQRTKDIYLVDDGTRADAFRPYAANGGFYFARHNNRTRHFFSTYLRMGDVTKTTKNEQNQFAMALSQHATLRGLRIQVVSREGDTLFPNGFHFHRRREYMRRMVEGDIQPLVFHMSWTANKDKKIPLFQQLGDWWVLPECVHVDYNISSKSVGEPPPSLLGSCCSAQPLFQCHYNNLPSIRPCREAPTNHENRNPSFW